MKSTPSESRVAWLPMMLVTREHLGAALARQAHRGERVGRLAGLRDADHEVVLVEHRVAVAELRRDVHLDGHARPLLDRVAADQAGVVRGAAGHDHDPAQVAQLVVGDPDVAEVHARRRRRRSATVSATASACSWISLSMKVS